MILLGSSEDPLPLPFLGPQANLRSRCFSGVRLDPIRHAVDRRTRPPDRAFGLRDPLLRNPRPRPGEPRPRQSTAVRPLRHSAPVVRAHRAAIRADPFRNRGRALNFAARPGADTRGLARHWRANARRSRGKDRYVTENARAFGRLYRMRLLVARSLRALQPKRPRRPRWSWAAFSVGKQGIGLRGRARGADQARRLSYCSIAWRRSAQTAARDEEQVPARARRQPSAAPPRAEREIDIRVEPGQLDRRDRGGGDASTGLGTRGGDGVDNRQRARVAPGIERLAQPRQAVAAAEARRHRRRRRGIVAELAEQRLDPRRRPAMPAAGERGERPRHHRVGRRPGRGDAARATKVEALSSWSASSTRQRRPHRRRPSSRPPGSRRAGDAPAAPTARRRRRKPPISPRISPPGARYPGAA